MPMHDHVATAEQLLINEKTG